MRVSIYPGGREDIRRGAKAVLELPAGASSLHGLEVGELLVA